MTPLIIAAFAAVVLAGFVALHLAHEADVPGELLADLLAQTIRNGQAIARLEAAGEQVAENAVGIAAAVAMVRSNAASLAEGVETVRLGAAILAEQVEAVRKLAEQDRARVIGISHAVSDLAIDVAPGDLGAHIHEVGDLGTKIDEVGQDLAEAHRRADAVTGEPGAAADAGLRTKEGT